MGRSCRPAAQAGVAGDRPDSEGSKAPRLARRRPYLGNQPPFGPKPGDLGARQDAHGPFLSRVRSGRNHITARPRALPAAPPEARVTERPCRANRADSTRRGGMGRRVPGATPRRLRSALVRGNRIRPTGSIRLLRDERPEEPGYRDAAMLPGARRRSPGKRRTRMPDAADTPGRGRRRPTSTRASPWKSSTSRRAACPCCATSTCRASAGVGGAARPGVPSRTVRRLMYGRLRGLPGRGGVLVEPLPRRRPPSRAGLHEAPTAGGTPVDRRAQSARHGLHAAPAAPRVLRCPGRDGQPDRDRS